MAVEFTLPRPLSFRARVRACIYTPLFFMLTLGVANIASANPVDGVVAAGAATISATGKTLDVHQQSAKAVIDWRGFDIQADETTQFHQPSSSSLTLNRISGAGPSQINGQLKAKCPPPMVKAPLS